MHIYTNIYKRARKTEERSDYKKSFIIRQVRGDTTNRAATEPIVVATLLSLIRAMVKIARSLPLSQRGSEQQTMGGNVTVRLTMMQNTMQYDMICDVST